MQIFPEPNSLLVDITILGDQCDRTGCNSEKDSYIENLIWKNCFLLAIITEVTTLIKDGNS